MPLYKTNILISQFDNLINSYIKNTVGECDDFLAAPLATLLTNNLLQLFGQNKFSSAGIGNSHQTQKNRLIRSDLIYWLDRQHHNTEENSFFDILDAFILYLNQTCYTGITSYEFHYAYFEKGSFYSKHRDRFQNNSGRAYSMILYLNPLWIKDDGGELCIYHPAHEQYISPVSGKCVFFKSSEIEHAVLETTVPRLSITGWLKTS